MTNHHIKRVGFLLQGNEYVYLEILDPQEKRQKVYYKAYTWC